MIPIDEVLEALELSRAAPGFGYLQSLFARFETASKILRNTDVADPKEKPRRPEVFWADHLSSGTGGTCFARVAAFGALLSKLGFVSRTVLGRVQSDFDHAALLVTVAGEEWICDVGFPLPALLPCGESETETPLGSLRVAPTPAGWRVEMLEGVPEGPRSLEVFLAEVSTDELSRLWQATFRPESTFLRNVSLRRERGDRVVSFAAGEIRVDDRHSRTRIPLPGPRAPILEGEFGVDRDILERAFAIAGDPEPAILSAEVSVYLETDSSAGTAIETISSPEGYEKLMSGAARVTREASAGEGFRLRLSPRDSPEEAGSVVEEIAPPPDRSALRVRRGTQESFYEAAVRSGRTYLVRRAVVQGPRLDLLRNDSLRGRFAGTLAVDLLAWSRLLKK